MSSHVLAASTSKGSSRPLEIWFADGEPVMVRFAELGVAPEGDGLVIESWTREPTYPSGTAAVQLFVTVRGERVTLEAGVHDGDDPE